MRRCMQVTVSFSKGMSNAIEGPFTNTLTTFGSQIDNKLMQGRVVVSVSCRAIARQALTG